MGGGREGGREAVNCVCVCVCVCGGLWDADIVVTVMDHAIGLVESSIYNRVLLPLYIHST